MTRLPNSDQLRERIHVLFGVAPPPEAQDQPNSPYAAPDTHIEEFDIPLPTANGAPVEPEQAEAIWLAAPNPAFGGRCPRNLIDGTDEERAFLASFLSSIEDGAFS